MKRRITEYWLYNHRFIVGHSLAIFMILIGLVAATLLVPSGLRTSEMASAVTSGMVAFQEFDPQSAINLPYHLMQRGSMALLGVSEFSLKLPSLILGLLSVVGMFLLIKEWFRHNVAVITVLLTATLPSFVFIAQDATPQIYPIAASIWLLVCGTYVTRRQNPRLLWKIIFSLILALNMYAPLGVYLNIAVVSTIVFHPHIRYLARRLSIDRIFISAACAVIVLAPLLYSVIMQPSLSLQLFGIPEQKPDLIANASQLFQAYFWQNGTTNGIFHPIFSIGTWMIMIIGFIRFLQVKYTARSYIIWLWGLMLLPLLLLNPDLAVITLPLAMLIIAMGMNTLIAEWYKLFPYNPYARVLGLIPLSVIVIGIVLSSGSRYTLNYHYNPEVANKFSIDTRLLKQTLARTDADEENPVTLVTTEQTLPYYQLVATYDKRFNAVSQLKAAKPFPYILAHDMVPTSQTSNAETPSYIAVNSRSQDSDRFYLYTAPSD